MSYALRQHCNFDVLPSEWASLSPAGERRLSRFYEKLEAACPGCSGRISAKREAWLCVQTQFLGQHRTRYDFWTPDGFPLPARELFSAISRRQWLDCIRRTLASIGYPCSRRLWRKSGFSSGIPDGAVGMEGDQPVLVLPPDALPGTKEEILLPLKPFQGGNFTGMV